MDCPVCGGTAEEIPTTIDGNSIHCPTCGEYDISSSVLATKSWQELEPEQHDASACELFHEQISAIGPH